MKSSLSLAFSYYQVNMMNSGLYTRYKNDHFLCSHLESTAPSIIFYPIWVHARIFLGLEYLFFPLLPTPSLFFALELRPERLPNYFCFTQLIPSRIEKCAVHEFYSFCKPQMQYENTFGQQPSMKKMRIYPVFKYRI